MSSLEPEPEGSLELTWSNKHLRLLAHEDGEYEWTDRGDHRVAEVRLLRDIDRIGDADSNNLLIRGDALHALRSLAKLPGISHKYAGKVRLAYLDPPFNTGQAFGDFYDDGLEHSVWLAMMRDRLEQVKVLLARNGTVWVHCDDAEQHRLRMVMDEVFGTNNFVATFVWQRTLTRRNDARVVSTAHDYIHVYGKVPGEVHLHREAATAKQRATYTNRDKDPRGDWLAIPFHAPGIRENLNYPIHTPGGRVLTPPPGRCWSTTEARFQELLADNRIYFGRDGNGMAQRKKFWDEEPTSLVPWTWWPYEEVGENREANREARLIANDGAPVFATPKPERLLNRIISLATDAGDLVLDCFVGSGTTAAVAHKLGRQWVGIEWETKTFNGYTRPRMEKVVAGTDGLPLSEDLAWRGGGGFSVLEVAPSMWEVRGGRVVLASWATGGSLTEAIRAQDGWKSTTDAPFSGRKGNMRLAVVDGLVTGDVAMMIGGWLGAEEMVTIYGTAVDPSADEQLRESHPGSRVKRVPQSILAGYRQQWSDDSYQWVDLTDPEDSLVVTGTER